MKKTCRVAGYLFLTGLFALTVHVCPAQQVINFSSLDKSRDFKLSGSLYLPQKASAPVGAIVLVHGDMGVDARGAFYRNALLDSGIAVFEVDFKTGIYTSRGDIPQLERFVPMAFGALKELRKLSAIDPDRIGIMGFSLGGAIGLRTTKENDLRHWMGNEKGFAAHVAFYPGCRSFTQELEKSPTTFTGAPLIILYGTADAYGEGEAAPQLKNFLLTKYNVAIATVEYKDAAHGFNLNAPSSTYTDPGALNGKGFMEWNANAANDSKIRVSAFLSRALAPGRR